ncbi:MAG TPA: hypothetical protein VIT68_00455 [Candidatus Gracilibacteria bacterium]
MKYRLLRDTIIAITLCSIFLGGAFYMSNDHNLTIEKILIGLFYTTLFFFVIDDLPKRLKQYKYHKLIRKELEYTLLILENLIDSLSLTSSGKNLKKKAALLLKLSPQKITVHDVNRSDNFSQAHRLETVSYLSIGEYLHTTQKKIKQVKRRLEKFTFFVDSELLEIIIDIEKFHLSWISELLKTKPKDNIPPEAIVGDLKIIVDLRSELKKYLKKY